MRDELVNYLTRENERLHAENEALKLRSVVDAESVVLVLDMADISDDTTRDLIEPLDDHYYRARAIAEKYRQAVMA